MKSIRMLGILLVILAPVALMSCASTYKPIMPQHMVFDSKDEGKLSYGYRYDVLAQSGNRKYAKKEAKRGIKLVAVEVENRTEKEIILREDVKFYIGDRSIFPMEPAQLQQQIKQLSGLYMLWSLLWVNITKCENNDCSVVPLPVGLLIGIGNTSTASNANKKLLMELMANNILDRKIEPGEKAVGLIGIATDQIQPIRIELIR